MCYALHGVCPGTGRREGWLSAWGKEDWAAAVFVDQSSLLSREILNMLWQQNIVTGFRETLLDRPNAFEALGSFT